ncbi:hypothetical protein CR513_23772, partial [Mucuna pruriens]
MPGIDPEFICHLCRYPQASVQLPKESLVRKPRSSSAGFIREIQYPTWLANVVMVKKANGKWRMCTDYIDLNKACPKDPYPLPSIDRLVDGASGSTLLSFMDA